MTLTNLLFYRKKTPANIAKKRLQIALLNQRANKNNALYYYFIPQLTLELLQVIKKYTQTPQILSIQLTQKDENTSILNFNIKLPNKNS